MLRPERLDAPVADPMLARLAESYRLLYGEEDPLSRNAEEFLPPTGLFLLAVLGGEAVGCGGYRRLDSEVVELKRMYVEPEQRGRGVAKRLLARLEEAASAAGARVMRLETGARQPAAIRLYEAAGYARVAPWDPKVDFRWSVCFEKRLDAQRRRRPEYPPP